MPQISGTPGLSKCQKTFVALDQWLQDAAMKGGDKSFESVLASFQNDINANIAYYAQNAEAFEAANEKLLGRKYRLMAKLYESISISKRRFLRDVS